MLWRLPVKLGLFGWRCYSGIGSQNYDLWRCGVFDKWLAPRYPHGPIPEYQPAGNVQPCRVSGDRAAYRRFVREIDALVLVERPMLGDFDLLEACATARKPVILIANWEWFPPIKTPWVKHVSAVWCPNQRCYDHLAALVAREKTPPRFELVRGTWGALLSEWEFVARERASTFVFAAGNGGVEFRKGEDVVAGAAALTPGVQWLVYSQKPLTYPMPGNVWVRVGQLPDRRDLYRAGDVMVLPSRWEGCGLSFYESQASGMPVLCPDAEPMRSAGLPRVFATAGERFQDLTGVPWRYQEPDRIALAALVRGMHGQPIKSLSLLCRDWMEANGDLAVIARRIRDLAERLVAAR